MGMRLSTLTGRIMIVGRRRHVPRTPVQPWLSLGYTSKKWFAIELASRRVPWSPPVKVDATEGEPPGPRRSSGVSAAIAPHGARRMPRAEPPLEAGPARVTLPWRATAARRQISQHGNFRHEQDEVNQPGLLRCASPPTNGKQESDRHQRPHHCRRVVPAAGSAKVNDGLTPKGDQGDGPHQDAQAVAVPEEPVDDAFNPGKPRPQPKKLLRVRRRRVVRRPKRCRATAKRESEVPRMNLS